MPIKFRAFIVVTFLLLFTTGSIFGQTSQELRFGTWVSGTLREGEEQWFSIRPSESGFLILETSGDTDTCLEAYDSSRTLISEDDDSGQDFNARLEVYAEAGRTYLFKLTSYEGDGGGPYRILASFDPVPPVTDRNTERRSAIAIQMGQPVPVFFVNRSESRWYSITVSQTGKRLVINTRGNTDTILKLYDSRWNQITEDDDSGENFNARVSVITDSAAPYYVEVTTYEGRQGRSSLFAEIRETGRPDRYEPDDTISAAKDIMIGEKQERTFSDAYDEDWVRLRITRSAVYRISSIAADGELDSCLELYDPDKELIAEDDDSGSNYDALLETSLDPGVYYIKVYCLDSDLTPDGSRYTLSVEMIR